MNPTRFRRPTNGAGQAERAHPVANERRGHGQHQHDDKNDRVRLAPLSAVGIDRSPSELITRSPGSIIARPRRPCA